MGNPHPSKKIDKKNNIISVRVPEEVYEFFQEHKEINVNEVVRKRLEEIRTEASRRGGDLF